MSSVKSTSTKSIPDNQCPDCNFKGSDKFPKGFGKENFQKTTIIKDKLGEEISIPVYATSGKPVLVSRRRCPVCGFKEDKLIG